MVDIKSRIKNLEIEANSIVDKRAQLLTTIKELDIRLHQIVGAINELNKIAQEGELRDEDNQSNQSRISQNTDETK